MRPPKIRGSLLPSSKRQSTSALLPISHNKTLFLSAESIVHRSLTPPIGGCDFTLDLVPRKMTWTIYITLRPGLEAFLRAARKARFRIVVFTWWPRGLTTRILNHVDPTGEVISYRLFLPDSSKDKSPLDLKLTGRRLDRSVVVDHNPAVNTKPWCNSIKVSPFTGDIDDVELHSLLGFFEAQRKFKDLRGLLHVCSCAPPFPGLPLPATTQKTLFLDLDETLIRRVSGKPPDRYDFSTKLCYVIKRPGVESFLQAAADNGYEIVIFTAGARGYACPIIDKLDPKGLITHRLYRDSCQGDIPGKIVKDLALTGRSLDSCVIIDDMCSRVPQKENAIRVTPFLGNMQDCELTKLLDFFSMARECEDLRDAVHLVNHSLGYWKL